MRGSFDGLVRDPRRFDDEPEGERPVTIA